MELADEAMGEDDIPLRAKIIASIKGAKETTIRPSKISHDVGISIDDASAELCSLLAFVEGSSFRFEEVEGGMKSMVFEFPPDFERRIHRKVLYQDIKYGFWSAMSLCVRFLKILSAFGLILSLAILSVAAVVVLIAALVAAARSDNRGMRHTLIRQMQSIFLSLRQILWCYALFGSDLVEGQDPFLREVAYDMSLGISLCCGNPSSLFFWIQAARFRNRRSRTMRGWAGETASSTSESGLQSLVSRRSWLEDDEVDPASIETSVFDERRGILSVAVEFLFGPIKPPGPSSRSRWRLRAAIILQKSSKHAGEQDGAYSIALKEFLPFCDYPPTISDPTSCPSAAAAMEIVAFFNGRPAFDGGKENISENRFFFPEFLAEPSAMLGVIPEDILEPEPLRFPDFLFVPNDGPQQSTCSSLPEYLWEGHYHFTKLKKKEFLHCVVLGFVNYIGVVWFAQSLGHDGVLSEYVGPGNLLVRQCLLPVLQFYSLFFFAVPFCRILLILFWNWLRQKRNVRRKALAALVKR